MTPEQPLWLVREAVHGPVALAWTGAGSGWRLAGLCLGQPPIDEPVSEFAAAGRWLERLIANDPSAVTDGLERCTWRGVTAFQRRVLETLVARVGAGQVVSYGKLAGMAGSPRASRAIGGVMGSNPYPLLIPCHRVVSADGRLGGFMRGAAHGGARKIAMLMAEGLSIDDRGRVQRPQ